MQQEGDVKLKKTTKFNISSWSLLVYNYSLCAVETSKPHVTDNFLANWTVIIRSNLRNALLCIEDCLMKQTSI